MQSPPFQKNRHKPGFARRPTCGHRRPLFPGHIHTSVHPCPFWNWIHLRPKGLSTHFMRTQDVWFALSGAILPEKGEGIDAALARGFAAPSAPGAAARAASGMLRAPGALLGKKACGGGYVFDPSARISDPVSSAGDDGNGPPRLSCEPCWASPGYRGRRCEAREIDTALMALLAGRRPVYPEHGPLYLEECLENLRQKGVYLSNDPKKGSGKHADDAEKPGGHPGRV